MTKKELIEILLDKGFMDKSELKEMSKSELKEMLSEYEDTSSFHPNETYEEFMEHEDFE